MEVGILKVPVQYIIHGTELRCSSSLLIGLTIWEILSCTHTDTLRGYVQFNKYTYTHTHT